MANRYILVYRDEAGNLRLSPDRLEVTHKDTVIWVSNLDEDYTAGNFVPKNPPGTQLFQQSSFTMPAEGQSIPGVVLAVVAPGQSPAPYSYTCSDSTGGSRAMAADGPVTGVIIVDPTGPGDGREEQKATQATNSKRQSAKEPALQANGSRR